MIHLILNLKEIAITTLHGTHFFDWSDLYLFTAFRQNVFFKNFYLNFPLKPLFLSHSSSLERPTLASRVPLFLLGHFPTNECEISNFCL